METNQTNVKDKDLCQIEDCFNRRSKVASGRYRRLCQRHWSERRNKMREYRHTFRSNMKKLSRTPCCKCGWNLSYTDRHRIVPGKDGGWYTEENTVSICPNCHRIETFGFLNTPTVLDQFIYDQRPTNKICIMPDCKNLKANAGYGRYRQVCEKHHRQRAQLRKKIQLF